MEVAVGRKHRKIAAEAELSQEDVNRAHLNAAAPQLGPQLCRCNVIIAARGNEWQAGETPKDRQPISRARKALQ